MNKKKLKFKNKAMKKVVIVIFAMTLFFGSCKKETYHQIHIICGDGGMVSPSGTIEVLDGEGLTLKFSPNEGLKTSMKINNISVGRDIINNTYSFSSVEKDYIVDIAFSTDSLALLKRGEWKSKKLSVRTVGTTPWVTFPWEDYGSYIFSEKQFQFFRNGKLTGDGEYSIYGTTLNIGGTSYQVLKLGKDSLKLFTIIKYYGKEIGGSDTESIEIYSH